MLALAAHCTKELFFGLDPFGQIVVHQEAGLFDHGLSAAQLVLQQGRRREQRRSRFLV